MRVLHAVAYFPPDRIGGVGEVAAHLHRALLAAGHDSRVLTAGTSRGDPRVERIARQPLGFVTRLAGQAERARAFDLVHCHHGDALGLLAAMRLRRIRTPALVTYHVGHRGMADAHRPYRLDGRRFGTGLRGGLYRFTTARLHRASDRLSLWLADGSSFVSRATALDVLGPERGARADVIHNALPPLEPGEPKPAPDPTELLYVGTDGARKRVLALPFALEQVRRAHPRARLRLVGLERERAAQLRALFEERGLREAVVWQGRMRAPEVRPFYAAAQVLLLPSAYEGLPMVVLEAMQCGLPCVATRVSGHPELIEDGVSGFLVDPDAPQQMAQRAAALLADPALRRRMGEAARATVAERFGVERQCAAYLALYRRLCGGGPEG